LHGAQLLDVAIDLGEVQIDDEVSRGVIFGVACALHQVFVLFAFVLVELAAGDSAISPPETRYIPWQAPGCAALQQQPVGDT
jgi:hypothetical protein